MANNIFNYKYPSYYKLDKGDKKCYLIKTVAAIVKLDLGFL